MVSCTPTIFVEYKLVTARGDRGGNRSPELKTTASCHDRYHLRQRRIFIRIATHPVDYIEPKVHTAFFFQRVGSSDKKFRNVNNATEYENHESLNQPWYLIVRPFDHFPHGRC